jgi:hypothetical protein
MMITNEDGSITLSEQRLLVCLEAAWELDALTVLLPSIVSNAVEIHDAYHSVRGIAGRIKALASVLMSGLSDEAETTEILERDVMVTERPANVQGVTA